MVKSLIHFDNRIVERSIRKGLVTQDEYDSFMNSLPDREADAEILSLEEEEAPAAARPAATAPAGDRTALAGEAMPDEAPAESAPFAALEGPSDAPSVEQEPVDTSDENA